MARRRLWIWVFAVIGAVSLAGGLGWYLFRTESRSVGRNAVKIRYSFGRVTHVEVDRNHDDRADIISKVSFGEDYPLMVDEMWEDRDFNGVFEYYFVPGEGDAFLAKVDDNQDGSFDRVIRGDEARELFPIPIGSVY